MIGTIWLYGAWDLGFKVSNIEGLLSGSPLFDYGMVYLGAGHVWKHPFKIGRSLYFREYDLGSRPFQENPDVRLRWDSDGLGVLGD